MKMGKFRLSWRPQQNWVSAVAVCFALLTGLCTVAQHANAQTAPTGQTPSFEKQIAPLLQQSCGKCHSGAASMGKLRLDSEDSILKGGASGPAIVPGASGSSLLMKRVLGLTDAPRMPMGAEPLDEASVKMLREWIDHADFSAAASKLKSKGVNDSSSKKSASNGNTSGPQSPLFASEIRPCSPPDATSVTDLIFSRTGCA